MKAFCKRMQCVLGAEPLERRDGLVADGTHGCLARPKGGTVDEHHTGAALPETAAEFRPVQFEIVAKDIKERRFRGGRGLARLTVHTEAIEGHRRLDFRLGSQRLPTIPLASKPVKAWRKHRHAGFDLLISPLQT